MKTKQTRRRYDSKYIVHDERRFVYFVIQKVACSSIETSLLPLFDVDTTAYEGPRKDGVGTVAVHKLFNESGDQIDRGGLSAGLDGGYRDYFKFAIVRNPWDRLVSCYSNKLVDRRKSLGGSRKRATFYPGMPFAEFVEAVHATPDEEANPHYESQYKTVCDSEGRVMADFVGRFEKLREDFAVVAERIGAPGLELPHRLKTRSRESRPYTAFYDERLKRLVAERYETDIETFCYSY